MLQKNQNLIVSNTFISKYVEDNLPEGRWQSGGREWVAASPFIYSDHKRHFSINIENGLWQCFKTGKQGNFVQLYAHIEHISHRRAWSVLAFKTLEESTDGAPISYQDDTPQTSCVDDIALKYFEPLTTESDLEDPLVKKAFMYLDSRKIFPEENADYYICRKGRYENRLIIPYTDEDNELYYFQARALWDQKPKYLNPGIDEGVRSRNVLYPFDTTKEVMVTEGPLDAISLKRAGFNATCTNGSTVSEVQAMQLKELNSRIVMAYDNDPAGTRGVRKFEELRKRLRMDNLYVCYPPKSFKDWNNFLCKSGISSMKEYINSNTYKYDSFYNVRRKLGLL